MIKTYTLVFFLLFGSVVMSNAQHRFAPVGAQWHHEMNYGVFEETSIEAKKIDGIDCRRITQKAGVLPVWAGRGLQVDDLSDIYMYNSNDTVFAYNNHFARFTPVYIYNVSVGDTVTLPVFPPSAGAELKPITDSVYSFVVDSIKVVQYDTANLETVFTHPLYVNGQAEFKYGPTGAYARRIGTVSGGLLPSCISCTFLLSDRYQLPGELRCYSEVDMSIKLDTGACDKNIEVSVPTIASHAPFSVYPNPNSGRFAVQGHVKAVGRISYQVVNMLGSVVHRGEVVAVDGMVNQTITVDHLPNGTYVLQLQGEGTQQAVKLVVQ